MKTSIIRYRVADFLKQSAPFDAVSEEDLLDLAATGKVSFHEAGEFVFRKSEQRKPWLWVIQQGTVEIIDEAEGEKQLRDLLGAGDLIGLGYFLKSESYLHSAKTAADVILYAIDARSFAALVTKYPRVARFLAAHFSVSARYEEVLQTVFDGRPRAVPPATEDGAVPPLSWLDTQGPSDAFLRARLRVSRPERSLRNAASEMTRTQTDATAIVDSTGRALGIITYRELIDSLASGSRSPEDACESVMVTRFPISAPRLTAATYLLQMMRDRRPILAITRDGTPESTIEGLLSDKELSLFTGRNPFLVLSELLNARTSVERSILLRQAQTLTTEALTGPATFDRAAEIASLFKAALAEVVVQASQVEASRVEPAITAVPHCWLLFGAAGRAELLEPLQPEIGVVYADPPDDQRSDVERYFQTIGEQASRHLADCGLHKPPLTDDERDVLHYRSLSDWKRFFREMITNPIENESYATRRFLDFRLLSGEPHLERELTASIIEALQSARHFIPILANDTMEHLPPMTFFHGVVIDLDGAERQTLDLGTTALSPIVDAARVYSLAAGHLDAKSTLERLDLAAATVPNADTVFREAANAFRVASYYQAVAARIPLNGSCASSLIDPSQLTKYDQRLLKTAFQAIQKLIEFASTPSQWNQRL